MSTSRPAPIRPPASGATMTAVVQDAYGETGDVLHVEQIERPTPGPDEVLLRVHAAGVDRGVWHLMAGVPYAVRLTGLRAPRNRIRGREVAGRVEAVGSAVTMLRAGDEVLGIGTGTFAQYATARATKLVARPATLPVEQAAVIGVSGTTALQAVRDHGRVQAGQSVLVLGASGGVGSFAVQIAKAYRAEVTGVASTGKLDLVRSLGADHVVDYTRHDLAAAGRRYDVVLDIGGNRPVRALRRLLTPTGTLVFVGGEGGGRLLGVGRQLRGVLLSPFVRQHLRMFVAAENAADLTALIELVTAGSVTPVVDRSFPLAEAGAAVQYMTDGRARGKVVVTV